VGPAGGYAYDLVRQPDGKLVAAGDGGGKFVLARYYGVEFCGDGTLGLGEECDDGLANGGGTSCCPVGCQLKAAGTPCNDGDTCTANDACHAGRCAGFPDLAPTYTVNTTVDAPDANPGDGVCETQPGKHQCTLRAALQEASVQPTTLPCGVRVDVPEGYYPLTIPGTAFLEGSSASLDSFTRATLTGESGGAIIDANDLDTALLVHAGANASISNVQITGGVKDQSVGGIYVGQGNASLLLKDVQLVHNFEQTPQYHIISA